MARPSTLPLATPEIEAVATAADVSTKTVRRYLAGVSVSGSSLRRIDRSLRERGHETLANRILGEPGAKPSAA